ncbi:MAG: hypothetical protein OXT65_05790 [Alphaproteobacteria bacterium]|nr:hypothetical protein [Alphaproteobacteria bacterium]
MGAFVQAVFIISIAQIAVVLGIGIISGQVLPSILGGFYAKTNEVSRTVITALSIFPIANFLTAYGYGHYNPAWIAPMILGTAVLANVAFAFFVMQGKLSFQLVLATMAVMVSCMWVSHLLQKTTA